MCCLKNLIMIEFCSFLDANICSTFAKNTTFSQYSRHVTEHHYNEEVLFRNRNNPCLQSQLDQYRILKYDIAVATSGTKRLVPLLLGRHNVVPGMIMVSYDEEVMIIISHGKENVKC